MANVLEKAGTAAIRGSAGLRDWRYKEIRHGDDGYNLYQDRMTKKYWVGTDDNPRQVWLNDQHKFNEAWSSSSFKQFTPSYVPPADEQSIYGARTVRDVSLAELTEHDSGFRGSDVPIEDIRVTGVDPNAEIQSLAMAGF
ncbi:hypothetical protein [Parvibaculum sp.]|uniref:hypothetical protein n=1 Tax=Parvibaculum sp. TaxID=2024848 RepID=UPI001D2914C7|nr:hypothetical protein [Parvibaculum sp.]MBX3491294.1 hypothetical protein [Parvibaculum sp.]MBX3491313.1 hypothetical protein [Parvibaculum sp.]